MTCSRFLALLVAVCAWFTFSPTASAVHDPVLGRWMERDPLGMSMAAARGPIRLGDRGIAHNGANLYNYVRGKPTYRVDPWGLADAAPEQPAINPPTPPAGEQPTIPKCRIGYEPVEDLKFDGDKFTFGKCKCDAVSGRATDTDIIMPGSDSPGGVWDYSERSQRIRDQGPIPDGKYWISTCEGRDATTTPSVHGFWDRDSYGWGDYSWPIHIWPGTDTLDEDGRPRGLPGEGFYIHGGAFWGSAGCIDLKNNDGTFRAFMDGVSQMNGGGCCYIPVDVNYGNNESFPVFKPDQPGECNCK